MIEKTNSRTPCGTLCWGHLGQCLTTFLFNLFFSLFFLVCFSNILDFFFAPHSTEEEEKGERKFSSPVTESARKANNNMINIDSLRKEAKKFTFKNEKLKLAFGRRVPDKIVKQDPVSPTKKKKIKEQHMRDVVNFQIVMNADEFRLYKRLLLAIPLEQDHYQAKAASEAATTATRRLSMYDYGNDTLGMWGGEPSFRTNGKMHESSHSSPSQPIQQASAAIDAATTAPAATAPAATAPAVVWTEIAAEQEAKYQASQQSQHSQHSQRNTHPTQRPSQQAQQVKLNSGNRWAT